MTQFEFNDVERETLRGLMGDDQWHVVAKILENLKMNASYAYNNAASDHRYFQGRLHGIHEVLYTLDALSRELPTTSVADKPLGFGPVTDGGRANDY